MAALPGCLLGYVGSQECLLESLSIAALKLEML